MKQFKILNEWKQKRDRIPNHPDSVPWDMVKPFEDQARYNHKQSLKVLHTRGGLAVDELYHVMNNQTGSWLKGDIEYVSEADAVLWLNLQSKEFLSEI